MAKSLKDAAKAGDKDVALILAKEVLQSRKAVSKMYTSMAQINSVMMSMDHQLGRSCDGHVMVMWNPCVLWYLCNTVTRDSSPSPCHGNNSSHLKAIPWIDFSNFSHFHSPR